MNLTLIPLQFANFDVDRHIGTVLITNPALSSFAAANQYKAQLYYAHALTTASAL